MHMALFGQDLAVKNRGHSRRRVYPDRRLKSVPVRPKPLDSRAFGWTEAGGVAQPKSLGAQNRVPRNLPGLGVRQVSFALIHEVTRITARIGSTPVCWPQMTRVSVGSDLAPCWTL
jgi:hypothetical protein